MRTVSESTKCRQPRVWPSVASQLANSIAAITFSVPLFALALQPPTAAQLSEARLRGDLEARLEFVNALNNGRASTAFVQQAKAKLDSAAAIAAGLQPTVPGAVAVDLPSTGSPKVLTILIDFSDSRAPAAPSPAFISANLYGNGTQTAQTFLPFESLNRYYFRASEQKLNFQGNVLGWYQFPNPRARYAPAPGATILEQNQKIFDLLRAAMDSFDATHDFTQYDNNGDGIIDAVTILFTGPKGDWATFWSGYMWSFEDEVADTKSWDGKKVKNFVFHPFETRGTGGSDFDPRNIIHHTGHLLGLPDLFDTTPTAAPTGGVGGLDLMDGTRGNLNAFARWALGWIEPTIVGVGSPARTVTLNAGADTALLDSSNPGRKAVAIFPNPATSPYNFFLLENRFRIGNDLGSTTVANSTLPSDGLLIWQVNAEQVVLNGVPSSFQNDNSNTTPKLLRLVEADGLSQIDLGRPGDLGDYYTSSRVFTPTSKPPSNDAFGAPTNVSVSRISASGRTMTALVSVPAPSSTVVATPVINPAGLQYTTPVSNITIACSTAGATIRYTIDGTTPTASSTLYTGPLAFDSATVIVRAKAFKAGLADSSVSTATFTYSAPSRLTNALARSGQAGNLGGSAYYVIDVPAGQTRLDVSISGLTGDADLYVKRGSLPTLSDYDFRPFRPGSAEAVVVSNPAEGPWYIMLHAAQAYSTVSLTAKYSRLVTTSVAAPALAPGKGTYANQVDVVMTTLTTGATIRYTTNRTDPNASSTLYTGPVSVNASVQLRARSFLPTYAPSAVTSADYIITPATAATSQLLSKNVATAKLSGLLSTFRYFKIDVPPDQNSLVIRTFGGLGNCDLYVNAPGRPGSLLPTLSDYDYRPFSLTSNETVSITDPPAGTWYIMLHGFAAYSSTSLIADYSRSLGQVATPQFSPLPGVYNTGSLTVTLASATANSTIRFTTNGSNPTTSSPIYTSPIVLGSGATTIRAQAFSPGFSASPISSASYTVNSLSSSLSDGVSVANLSGAVATEQVFVIRVVAGQTKLVVKTSGGTGDCDLYIRKDSPPTTSSFDLQSAKTGNAESIEILNPDPTYYYILLHGARAFAGVTLLADYSSLAIARPATPIISPATTTFDATPVTVTLSTTLAGASIRYTLDGTNPTVDSPLYTAPILLSLPDGSSSGTREVRAITVSGGATSLIASKIFTLANALTPLSNGVAATVPTTPADAERHFVINVPASQSKLDIATVIATGATGDCDLYIRHGARATRSNFDYAPLLAGNIESVSITNPTQGDWYVMLVAKAGVPFTRVSVRAAYTPTLEQVATPVFTPSTGTYSVQALVAMTSTTPGATIRYTTDGSEPSEVSTPYLGPIRLSESATLKAKAFRVGFATSGTQSAVYTITAPPQFSTGDSGALTGLSAAQGILAYYKFNVPAGDTNDKLTISTTGTGDSDLFVKFGSTPSSTAFDFRPTLVTGSNESVVINRSSVENWAGDWYILLVGQQSYSNVTLKAILETTVQSVVAPVITSAAASAAVATTPTTSVTISSATTLTKIYYTLDGSEPTTVSPTYSGAFALPSQLTESQVTVKALATKAGFNSASSSSTITVAAATATSLTSGVPVTNLANLARSQTYYKITVGSTARDRLVIAATPALLSSGDCDLYVKFGAPPTIADHDFKSASTGNNETATITNPAEGDWYIMLVGFANYTKVNLTATASGTVAAPVFSQAAGSYVQSSALAVELTSSTPEAEIFYSLDGGPFSLYSTPIQVGTSGDPVTISAYASKAAFTTSPTVTRTFTVSPPATDLTSTGQASNLSGVAGSERYFSFTVPSGDAFVKFETSGNGDCDLFVKRGGLPSLADYDERPGLAGISNETVLIANPSPAEATTYYVMLRGIGVFSDVTLQVTRGTVIGTVDTPVISPGSQTSASSVTVSLSCSTPLATILYTTDGSTPSSGSPTTSVYTGPFIVSSNLTPGSNPPSTTVNAVATRALYASSSTASATYVITDVPAVTDLGIGVANKLAGLHSDPVAYPTTDTSLSVYYKVTLPAGTTALTISTYNDLVNNSGQTSPSSRGDCDLYVRKGDFPTLSVYDQRPYKTGNFESALVTGSPGDVFYIMLYRYAAYDGVTVEARDATGYSITEINNTPYTATGLSAPSNDYRYFKVTVPSNAQRLQFSTSGGTGDCDIYAAYKHVPVPVYEYFSRRRGNTDSIVVRKPEAGVWYVLLQAFSPYSGVSLNVSISN